MVSMEILQIFTAGGITILGLMVFLWIFSLYLKDASIVDIFWGAGFIILAWLYFFLTPDGYNARKYLISLLVTIWGLRLSIHIFLRNRGQGEDFRYQKFRQDAGKNWWWFSLFKVFVLQGALMWIISTPLLAGQYYHGSIPLSWLDITGVTIWLVGFIFEAGGDWQLRRFKSKPENKGRLLKSGLWYYTRHPNYFGDAVQWWGFYIISLSAGGWWTFFSPALMTYLLWRVSGVTLLEKSLILTKPGYQDYIETTGSFFPWKKKSYQETGKSD